MIIILLYYCFILLLFFFGGLDIDDVVIGVVVFLFGDECEWEDVLFIVLFFVFYLFFNFVSLFINF